MSDKLTPAERAVVQAVNAFAFVNPFSPERDAAEQRFIEATGGALTAAHADRFAGFFAWAESLPAAKRELGKFRGAERETMRIAFLFESYHRNVDALDKLITEQVARGHVSCAVPFGASCLEWMESRGFTSLEAVRYFGIFFQLRRAHYFIVRGLKGSSPCMSEFRKRLWTSVFTDDVRWYERHLWNRMEDFSTLLLGETGSGKGAAAAAIGRSAFIPYIPERREFAESFSRSFVSINLAEFPETLIEAELFGYRKGAFTGAVESREGVLARCSPHGAIFLDEIGEVNASIQVKLLHVLQDRVYAPVGSREPLRFRGRVISATNRSIEDLRSGRRFRDDFYYRISSDVITVPTLRQRIAEHPGELEALLEVILERMVGDNWAELLPAVRDRLHAHPGRGYPWPGNVRELEQAVRRVLLTGRYEPPPALAEGGADHLLDGFEHATLSADELLAAYARKAVDIYGTRAEAARRLGLDTRTVEKYLARPRPHERKQPPLADK